MYSSLNLFANIANDRGFQRLMRKCQRLEEKNFFLTFAKVNMLIKYSIIFELTLIRKWIHYLNIIKIILSNLIHFIYFKISGIFFCFCILRIENHKLNHDNFILFTDNFILTKPVLSVKCFFLIFLYFASLLWINNKEKFDNNNLK